MERVRIPLQIRRALDAFRQRLSGRFGDALCEVVLFGSVARGEAHEGSDVDVLVVLRAMQWAEKRAVLNIAADLWTETGLQISPTVLDLEQRERWRAQGRPLLADVERDGVRL